MATTTSSTTGLSITSTATQQDAQLLVSMFNGPLALRAQDGLTTLYGYDEPPTWEQFDRDHPHGTEEARCVSALLNLNEEIATFVKHGLLDRDLVFDLLWVQGAWERCASIALHYRETAGEPEIYANFERLAMAQAQAG